MNTVIGTEHDYFHDAGDDPYWNESGLFMFQVPDRNLSGFVYFYHRPNMKYSVGGVGVWNGDGENIYDCLYHEWSRQVPLPAGAQMYDFTLENGLTVACKEPLSSYRIEYHNDGCDLELDWNAIMAVHPSGLPQQGAVWGAGRYEQAGRAVGTLRVDDGDYEIDWWSCRDHSWGSRKWTNQPRTHFPWAIASPRSAFQVLGFSPLESADDPVAGVTDNVVTGWYIRDGEVATLVSGERTVERGPDGRPLRTRILALDDRGRTLDTVGECRNHLLWTGYPHLWQWWCLTKWTFDGHEAWGEEQDILPSQDLRRFMRRRRRSLSEEAR